MKKITLIAVLVGLIYTTNTQAQDFSFGVKAGLNVSSLSSNAGVNYGSKPGFHAGVAAEIPFSDAIYFQPEVLVTLQGTGSGLGNDINLFYLSVPFAVKYNIWDELHIEAGPQLGVLISDNIDVLDTNKLDLGVLVGAGYRLDDNFYFQLRFNAGFINVIEDSTSKNRVLQVSAIYFF